MGGWLRLFDSSARLSCCPRRTQEESCFSCYCERNMTWAIDALGPAAKVDTFGVGMPSQRGTAPYRETSAPFVAISRCRIESGRLLIQGNANFEIALSNVMVNVRKLNSCAWLSRAALYPRQHLTLGWSQARQFVCDARLGVIRLSLYNLS